MSRAHFLFADACRALEKGEAEPAQRAAAEMAQGWPAAAESIVLERFVRRRAEKPAEPWLEALLTSWEEAGRPENFTPMPSGAPTLGLATQLMTFCTPAQLLDGAIGHLGSAEGPIPKLWLLLQMRPALNDPDLRPPALAHRNRLAKELATMRPNDFGFSSLPLLACGGPAQLESGELDILAGLIERHQGELPFKQIYDELVKRRQAKTAKLRHLAFLDAVLIMPDPLIWLLARTRRVNDTKRAAAVLEAVGRKYEGSRMLMSRVQALAALRWAAKLKDVDGSKPQRELDRLRSLALRFEPDWPIEQLRIEVIDALAANEYELALRCRFGPR